MMLTQLGSLPLILASDSQSARLKGLADRVIIVDDNTTNLDQSYVILPVPGAVDGPRPDHPAYVIFTSGSTGKSLITWVCTIGSRSDDGLSEEMLTWSQGLPKES